MVSTKLRLSSPFRIVELPKRKETMMETVNGNRRLENQRKNTHRKDVRVRPADASTQIQGRKGEETVLMIQ